MKTLVIANQKGGVGKTTLLFHLAHYAAEAGSRVLVVDLDAQGNASNTLAAFASGATAAELFAMKPIQPVIQAEPRIALMSAGDGLVDIDRAKLDILQVFASRMRGISERGQFDFCLIDTAPALGLRMIAALSAADYVISPIELQAYSVDGINAMLKTIYGVRQKLNPDLQVIGMLPSRVNAHSPAQKANLVALLQSYPDLVTRRAIVLRTSIAEAASEKVPVWAMHKTTARDAGREMKDVLAHIIERMGGLPSAT